jgi:probable HAF family extracellular repeat protein
MNTLLLHIGPARNVTRRAVIVLAVLAVVTGTFAWRAYAGSAALVGERSGVTVSGINDRGQVIGTVTRQGMSFAFVWKNGSLKLLGPNTEADAINDHGEILGQNTYGQYVLWNNGRTKRLGLHYARALNDRGQVLGCRGADPARCSNALWTNGRISLLPFDSDLSPAMNNRGQVVGRLPNGDAGEWQNGKVTDLGLGYPTAINDHGEILGQGPNGDVTVWRNGTATDIAPGWPASPVSINERGQVILSKEITTRISHTFIWSNGRLTDLGNLYVTGNITRAISRSGQVVGTMNISGAAGPWHAVVWQDGRMTRLPAPKDHAGSPTLAVAINDHNQIVGDSCSMLFGCSGNGGPRGFAVLWTLHGRKIKTVEIVKGHS